VSPTPPGAPPVRAAGAVLTGGSSQRMGTDKALLELDGTVLACRVAGALTAAGCAPVVAVGGDASRLARHGLTVVADRHPGEGPLGAIITVLEHLEPLDVEVVVVLACDLADADPRAVHAVLEPFATDPGLDVVVPRGPARRHMHHAAWHRRVLPELRLAFAAGERAPRRVLERLRVLELPVAGLDPRWLADLDTPDDLARRRAGGAGRAR
jgi:molybdopterin-guanine dinucleotide biosynthesis protein A